MIGDGPDLSTKMRFYETGIGKFIKNKNVLNPQAMGWLIEQAWIGWTLNISTEEMKLVQVFEKICSDLFSATPDVAEIVFKSLYNILPEVEDRSFSVHELIDPLKSYGNDEESRSKRIRVALSQYNCLYENEFKAWSVPVYAAAIYLFKMAHNVGDPADVVHVATTTKIQTIRDVKDLVPYGDMSIFVKGFDNEIRNAGVGHESFEIHDDGSFSLRVTNPYSGAIKGSGIISLTERELHNLMRDMRKTIWFFKIGFNVFLANNKHLVEKIAVLGEMKVRDIKKAWKNYCDNRWLDIEKFEFDNAGNILSACLKYAPQIIGEKSQVFIGVAEAYDLVKRDRHVNYKEQILGCLYRLVKHFETRKSGVPNIKFLVQDNDGNEVMNLEYLKEDLILFSADYEKIPIPVKGEYSDKKYVLSHHVRVPYGEHDKWKTIIGEWERNGLIDEDE